MDLHNLHDGDFIFKGELCLLIVRIARDRKF